MVTAGLVSAIVTWVLWGLILTCMVALIWIVVSILRFKHRIRVRIITGSKKFIKDDKFRVVSSKDGKRYIKLMKRKDKLPLPPPESIDLMVTLLGTKMCVEAYYTEEGEYKYIKESNNNEDLKKWWSLAGSQKTEKGTYAYISDQNTHVPSFAPLDTDQRLLLIDHIAKANQRRGITWAQYVPLIASGAILIIIFVLTLAFWEDITAPSLEAQKVHLKIVEEQKNLIEAIDRIDRNTQVIGGLPPDVEPG